MSKFLVFILTKKCLQPSSSMLKPIFEFKYMLSSCIAQRKKNCTSLLDETCHLHLSTLLCEYRVTKKTCQLVIFQRNNTAKYTKICIEPNQRTASPNLRSDFNYFYTKWPKIAIKILKKWEKSLHPFFFFFSVS